MTERISLFRKTGGVWQSGLVIFGNIFGQALAAVALIFITRLLGPEKFGAFSVGFAVVLMLVRINEMGLSNSILKFASSSQKAQERNKIYSLTLQYKLVLSALLMVVGIVFAKPLAAFINIENPFLITVAFTIGLTTVYYEHLLSVLQSLHLFFQTVIINVIQASFKLFSVGILFFLSQTSVVPIFILYVSAPLVPVLFFRSFLPTSFKFNFKIKDFALRKKILQLTKHSSIALVSAGIIENIDVLFLQKNLSSYETGLYGGASRIAMLFALVAYSLGNVLYPRVARYKSQKHLQSYLYKAGGVFLLAIIGFLGFLPFARLTLLLTIGSEYLSGLPILVILSAASFLAIASVPFIALFYSYNSAWYFSISGIIQLIIVLAGNFLFVPAYGLEAAAWTRFASRVFLLFFSAGLGIFLYWKNYARMATKKV